MSDKVDIWKWVKWIFKMMRVKYWLNLFLTFLIVFFAWLSHKAAGAADCGPCAGFGWGFLAFMAVIANLMVLFGTSPRDIDDFFNVIFEFLNEKWQKITGYFSNWWQEKP